MSTPSEKPTCEHGETEEHPFRKEVSLGVAVSDWCPGPIIVTPEKSTIYKCVCRFSGTKGVKTRKDGEDDYWTCPGCKTEYGPVKPYPGPVIATEPEKPVSKRRTPPAWPAYHGENPTCAHRQIEAHNFFAQMRIGNSIHYTTETMWCPGPVIATPEKCEHTLKEHFLALLDPRIGPFTGDKICQPVTVSMEPETPASEATPELRERIEALRPSKDRFLSAYEEGRRDAIYDVLDVLGEPK